MRGVKHLGVAKLTSKGQITLPKAIRDLLNIDQGDQIIFDYEDNSDSITMHKVASTERGTKLELLLANYDEAEASKIIRESYEEVIPVGREIL